MKSVSEEKRYKYYFENKEKCWESLCNKCGACCGAYDDPCKHLKKGKNSRFHCEIYSSRFGTRATLNGEKFDCVSIKKILHTRWKGDHLCTYKRHRKALKI